MAELKRTFEKAKMNKDMDERVVQPGQYRDAHNIQITSSDGSDVGAVQSLLSNKEVTEGVVDSTYATTVGVLKLPEKDLVYYFVAGGGVKGYAPNTKKDYIIEYDTISQTSKYVFVDIYNIKQTQIVSNNTNNYFTIADDLGGLVSTLNKTGVRIGMNIVGSFTNATSGVVTTITTADNVLVTDVVKGVNTWKVYHDYNWSTGGAPLGVTINGDIYFVSAERVLNFNPLNKINGINHLDGMIFWTDNIGEPKKINIERSKRGTGGGSPVKGWNSSQLSSHANNTTGLANPSEVFIDSENNNHYHTRLVVSNAYKTGLELAMQRNSYKCIDVKVDHTTVIKKAPKFPLELEMSTTSAARTPEATTGTPEPLANQIFTQTTTNIKFTDSNGDVLDAGVELTGLTFADPVDFRVGDVLILINDTSVSPSSWDPDTALVRVVVTDAPNGMPNNGGSAGPYDIKISSAEANLPNFTQPWLIRLEEEPAMFEFKYPRFSYRWKFQDGEYSTFAPWTTVAFIPGDFDYLAKKGYNLGMRNRLRSLKLKNYFSEFALVPADVVQVDLLYKEEGSTSVYTVKELTRKDGSPEWPDRTASQYNRGLYTLSSEIIHSVVPSNQMLRPWDNVPRKALAQEMTSNRLVFGNYLQNYNVTNEVDIRVGMSSIKYGSSDSEVEIPEPSAKTLRTYQIGVVFADRYGRESPVLVPKKSSSITLKKKFSCHTNRITAKLTSPPPSWAKYLKYYVKETSNEYYNLSMDRWYDAEDGNVWISFPSAERNKIDEETYLILKNEHDSNKPVFEEGRYKVIAISPDAPLFVKTTKKSHGSAQTVEQNGLTLAGTTNILVEDTGASDPWRTTFGGDWMADVYAKAGPGAFHIRIVAQVGTQVVASEWRSVVAIKKLATGERAIKIRKKIGDTADALAILGGTPVYKLEVREDIVENRPEFDGRFFVKVYKDLLLQQVVMKTSDESVAYTVLKSFDMRCNLGAGGHTKSHPANNSPTYVNSNGIAATHQHHGAGGVGHYNWTRGSWGNNNFDNSNKFGYCSARKRTRLYLKDYYQNVGWFIDGLGHGGGSYTSTGDDYCNYRSGTIHHNANNGLHNSHGGGQGPGNGGLRHSSANSTITFGRVGRWFSDLSGSELDFKNTMSTTGTIFRFRDDPTNEGQGTPYIINKRLGHKQLQNYAYSTTGCKVCNQNKNVNDPHCKRCQITIEFEKLDGGGPMDVGPWDPLSAYKHDAQSKGSEIDILQLDLGTGDGGDSLSTENPAIWETEPKEDIGLDIYYEASGSVPLGVTHEDNELLIPLLSTFYARHPSGSKHTDGNGNVVIYKVLSVNSTENPDITNLSISPALTGALNHDSYILLERYDGSRLPIYISKDSGNYASGANVIGVVTGLMPVDVQTGILNLGRAPQTHPLALSFYNCWQFGNGIESDRIRDDYNAPQLTNGVKASTVLAEPYAEEHRSSGLIWSGIFNSTSGVNNLNQFIQAEPITKDLSPAHGSLQKLYSRNTDTLAFCEDKVLRLTTDKDAIFKADGNPQLVASNKVIGQSTPIQGDFGISTDPESLAITPTAVYWVDRMRGQVLRLTGGVTIENISNHGMKDYFNDNLKGLADITGTFDDKKGEYNLTLGKKNWPTQYRSTRTTISYNEQAKGWVSFRSFNPENGFSLNNEYYTFKDGSMWKHHDNDNVLRNNFYGSQNYSEITMLFNDQPGSVKSFNLLNYEGTQSRITPSNLVSVLNASGDTVTATDLDYYDLNAKTGWYVKTFVTNLQETSQLEFKDKEGKWFSTVKGVTTSLANLDEKEFSVQGLGSANSVTTGTPNIRAKLIVAVSTASTSGTNWDTTADSNMWMVATQTPAISPVLGGSSVTAGSNVNTIHNITYDAGGGVYQYSGLNLNSKNFSVPGGTHTVSGATHVWTKASGWNGDTEVARVEFTDIGIADDPGNTIKVEIFYNTFTMPASGQKTIYVDVDHAAIVQPPGHVLRESCLHVSFAENSNDGVSITYADITNPNIVESVVASWLGGAPSSSQLKTVRHTGQVLEGQSHLIADYTVTADSGRHLSPPTGNDGVDAIYFVRNANAAWEQYYTLHVSNTNYSGSNTNLIQSSRVKIFYSPPVGVSGLDPDPISGEGNFCSHLHDVRLTYLSRPINSNPIVIQNVSVPTNPIARNGQASITVNSSGAGNASLHVVKLNTALTAWTHSYNFTTNAFVALVGEGDGAGTVGSPYKSLLTFGTNDGDSSRDVSNQVSKAIQMPDIDESKTYSAFMSAGSIGLAANVPDAINELNFTTVGVTGAQTFTPLAVADVTVSGSTAIPSLTELSVGGQQYPFTFTYTKGGREGISMSLNSQPNDSNITGSGDVYLINNNPFQAGDTTVQLDNVDGIKVGMDVIDVEFHGGGTSTNRLPLNCKVTAINTSTKVITLSAGPTASIPQFSEVEISSEWGYELVNTAASINSGNTVVTVTGFIKINTVGRATPNGSITLTPNFITIT